MILAILFSIIPVLILFAVMYNMGEVKKQPLWVLLILFIGGCLSWVLVRYVSRLLGNDIYKSQMEISTKIGNKGFFLVSFGIIAIIEELCKYVITLIMCFKNKYFKNPFDAVMYAACISLGFAFIENIIYINNYGMSVALSRAIFSIPVHACFGIMMGYFLGLSKLCKDNDLKNDFVITGYSAFFIPFLFHGLYDFLLNFQNQIIYIIFIVYVLIMYTYSIILLVKLSKFDINKLKSKRLKKETPVFQVQPQAHKNIYYNNIYSSDNKENEDINNKDEKVLFDDENKVKSDWKNAESNKPIYEKDKVEMDMFRNDKQ